MQCCVQYHDRGKAFYRSIDGNFGKSIACREGKYVSRVIVHSSKNKMLPFPWWKQSNIINLALGSWLITPGNGTSLRTQCCPLLLLWCLLLNTSRCFWNADVIHCLKFHSEKKESLQIQMVLRVTIHFLILRKTLKEGYYFFFRLLDCLVPFISNSLGTFYTSYI